MVEHLLRHYKKRPRNLQLTCTSITFLIELSRCILSGEKSLILPRECYDYLKNIDTIDAMPTNFPSQIDNNHWHLLLKLRRTKIESETRLKCCAFELAEAEQTQASHQRLIQNLQNNIQQFKETIDDEKKLNYELLQNIETQLILKMGQIEIFIDGQSSEYLNSVLVPFDELLRVNRAIVDAGKKKINAMNCTIEYRRLIEWKEWKHCCMQITLDDMKDELKFLQGVKVTKEIQMYLMRHHDGIGLLEKDNEISKSHSATRKRFKNIIESKKIKLIDSIRNINYWQMENNQLTSIIENIKLQNNKILIIINDENYKKENVFLNNKFHSIMMRNKIVKKIQDNYGNLLALQAQLELLKLKTYPTLKFKNLKNTFN
ncbi:cilia- and flagella-associated protein 43-like [Aphidius gifuensis]|nr:cilia- and flagella-associated protein 43-like [Aphidius gifuensis]